jgi:hypothetical protein
MLLSAFCSACPSRRFTELNSPCTDFDEIWNVIRIENCRENKSHIGQSVLPTDKYEHFSLSVF